MDNKALARAAVRAEFKKKRKRNKKYDGDSSDEEKPRKHARHQRLLAPKRKPPKEEEEKVAKPQSKYRDRAKERRDGFVIKEESTVIKQEDDVNDLDFVLSQALTRPQEIQTENNEKPLPSIQTSIQAPKLPNRLPETSAQALELLQSPHCQVRTTLGRAVREVLLRQFGPRLPVTVTPAGRAVRQSYLQFSSRCHPGRDFGWEPVNSFTVPNEREKFIPEFSDELMDRIKMALRKKAVVKQEVVEETVKEPDSEDDIFQDVGDYDPFDDD